MNMMNQLDLEFESAYRGESVAFGRESDRHESANPSLALIVQGEVPRRRPRRGLREARFHWHWPNGDTPWTGPPRRRRTGSGVKKRKAHSSQCQLQVADASSFTGYDSGFGSSTARCSTPPVQEGLSAIDRACGGTGASTSCWYSSRAAIRRGRSMRSPRTGARRCPSTGSSMDQPTRLYAGFQPASWHAHLPGHPQKS